MKSSRWKSWWPGLAAALAVVVVLALGVALRAAPNVPTSAEPARSNEPARPPEFPKEPKAVEVQVFVIMASKGEVEHTDSALKELADLMKTEFTFNRFRLHKSSQSEIRKDKASPFQLISDYTLWGTYLGASKINPAGVVNLSVKLVRTEEVTDSKGVKKKVDKSITPKLTYALMRDRFILIGGPQVGEETMILAIRVMK